MSVFVFPRRFSGCLLSELVTKRGQARLIFQFAHDLSAASPARKGGRVKGLLSPTLSSKGGEGEGFADLDIVNQTQWKGGFALGWYDAGLWPEGALWNAGLQPVGECGSLCMRLER
jgi:hypothetical protein